MPQPITTLCAGAINKTVTQSAKIDCQNRSHFKECWHIDANCGTVLLETGNTSLTAECRKRDHFYFATPFTTETPDFIMCN